MAFESLERLQLSRYGLTGSPHGHDWDGLRKHRSLQEVHIAAVASYSDHHLPNLCSLPNLASLGIESTNGPLFPVSSLKL